MVHTYDSLVPFLYAQKASVQCPVGLEVFAKREGSGETVWLRRLSRALAAHRKHEY